MLAREEGIEISRGEEELALARLHSGSIAAPGLATLRC